MAIIGSKAVWTLRKLYKYFTEIQFQQKKNVLESFLMGNNIISTSNKHAKLAQFAYKNCQRYKETVVTATSIFVMRICTSLIDENQMLYKYMIEI